jgi:hypothetical protein
VKYLTIWGKSKKDLVQSSKFKVQIGGELSDKVIRWWKGIKKSLRCGIK